MSYKNIYSTKKMLKKKRAYKIQALMSQLEVFKENKDRYRKLIAWYCRGSLFKGDHWYESRRKYAYFSKCVEEIENDLRAYRNS